MNILAQDIVYENITGLSGRSKGRPVEYGQRAFTPSTTKSIDDLRSSEDFGCGIRSGAEDIHAYSEGRRRSPSEYENITSQPDQGIQGFIPFIAKYVWQLCIFVGIIFLIHQIYEYLKKSFTTPIKTNLVQLYQTKYNEIAEQYTRDKKSHDASDTKVTQSLLLLPLFPLRNSEEKFDSEQGIEDANPYNRRLEGFGRDAESAVEASIQEELSTTQKDFLSRELLSMIQKSI